MKKLVLGLSILGGMTFAIAQDSNSSMQCSKECCHRKEGKKAPSQAEIIEKMKKDLELTEAQVKKIQDLHNKENKEREAKKEQHKAKIKERHEIKKKEMKSILTSEQYKKWEEQMEKRKNEKMKRNPIK